MTMNERNENLENNPFTETVYDERPVDDKGRPVNFKIRFATPTGRFARMVKRALTVHHTGVCPNCGGRLRFRKDIPTGKGKYEHNKWVCQKCNSIYAKEGVK